MSRTARILIAAGAIAVLVVAFIALRPSDDGGPPPTQTAAAPPPAVGSASTAAEPAPPPAPEFAKIRVRDGKPVGGVKRTEVKKGSRARIEISSPDTSDEIHVHGYDLSRDLKAGGKVRFSFEANADGIYEIELEGAGVQIGELVVRP